MGDLDRAIAEFETAGDDPDACFNLGLSWFFKRDFVRSVNAFRRGIFENVHLAVSLADVEPPPFVPTFRGTHPKELDGEDAALEYGDRCGDLWMGRELLRAWLKGIYEHPIVQDELKRHLEHVMTLSKQELSLGEAARLEGQNAVLRAPERLAKTDAQIAKDVMAQVFRLSDTDGGDAGDRPEDAKHGTTDFE
jgi:hypothetical protein